MSARTSPTAAGRSAAPKAGGGSLPRRGDAIDQWLSMFTRFLRLSAEQKQGIRDELDSHVRERVRDLMLAGLNEDEGVRRAIDELGEAAELAAHFNAAHRPTRRTLMSVATIGVAASAAVISIFALAQTPAPQPAKRVEGVPVLADVPLLGNLFTPGAAPAGQFEKPVRLEGKVENPTVRKLAEMLADASGKRLSLNAGEFDVNKALPAVELVDADAKELMRLINERAQLLGDSRFDYRVRGDVLEVAPARAFDRAETLLVAYDLTTVFASRASSDELQETIATFVEPEGWRNNGGDTAQMKVVGNRMFVQAPPRYHAGVAWILEQFGAPSARRRTVGEGPARLAMMLERQAGTGGAEAAAPRAVGRDLDLHRAEFLKREIAWQKARLGEQLSPDELALLDDRAVHSPDTAAAVDEARRQLDALRAELEAVRKVAGSGATPAAAPAAAAPSAAMPPTGPGQVKSAPPQR